MKREIWKVGLKNDEKNEQLDSLCMAREIVKAMASGGAGSKWGRNEAGNIIEETYLKIESIRKAIK